MKKKKYSIFIRFKGFFMALYFLALGLFFKESALLIAMRHYTRKMEKKYSAFKKKLPNIYK